MDIMVSKISSITARDIVRIMLKDVIEIPTIEAAKGIAEEYRLKGGYVDQTFLVEVWMDIWGK